MKTDNLDDLPEGTVVLDFNGWAYQKDEDGDWYVARNWEGAVTPTPPYRILHTD